MPTNPERYKIKKLGFKAEAFVNRLRAEGYGYRSIANKVEETFGVDISHGAVKNYLENAADEFAKRIGQEDMKEMKKEEFKKVLKVESQLQQLNEKLQNAINTLDETSRGDMKLLRELAKEIREQLKFHKKFIEQISSPDTQINMNKTQIAIKVSNELERLEEEGVIEIKKPKQISIEAEE